VILYALNHFVIKPNCSILFFHYYLNDLFAMPFVIAYSNLLISFVGKPAFSINTRLRISLLTLLCIAIWEGVGPCFIPNSTRDLYDVIAYSTGSTAYFVFFGIVAPRSHEADQ
jgi:hypothetical protein